MQQNWQPITTAPKHGRFIAWSPLIDEARTVELFASPHQQKGAVINTKTGKWFIATHWMPFVPPVWRQTGARLARR